MGAYFLPAWLFGCTHALLIAGNSAAHLGFSAGEDAPGSLAEAATGRGQTGLHTGWFHLGMEPNLLSTLWPSLFLVAVPNGPCRG